MKDLHLDSETLDQMFKTIDDNFKELRNSINTISDKVKSIETDLNDGGIITGIQVTVDDSPAEAPSCETAIIKVGRRSLLTMNFKGLRGNSGVAGSDGKRGNIIYVGTDTTTSEASNRLTEMVGSNEFRIGDLFLNSKSFELKECIRSGIPEEARWKLLGILNGTSIDLGEQTGIFTGNKDQLTLGDGSVVDIDKFIEKYLQSIKDGLKYFRGGGNQLVLGNGGYLTIGTMLDNNIDYIRTKLGVVTTEKEGLVPRLPILIKEEPPKEEEEEEEE